MIQDVLNGFIEKGLAAGVSALVYRDGREAFFGCAGKKKLGAPQPFTRDTLMRMYSMTKVMTAAAIMTLADKGVLSADTRVGDILPAYRELSVIRADGTTERANTPLTVRHLLTMTSGIPYPGGQDAVSRVYAEKMSVPGVENMTTLDMANMIAACPLCFHPGEKWMYGLSADVLGGVIVAATGMELSDYMKKAIFDPLGMQDTFFTVPDDKKNRVAGLYQVGADGALAPREETFGFPAAPARVEMGGAGLYSTVDDYMKFGEMLRMGGKHVLSEKAVRDMATDCLTDAQRACFWDARDGYGYGYLVRVMTDASRNADYGEGVGAFGWNGMGGTTLRVDPARGVTVVFGIQRVPPEHEKFLPALLRAVRDDICK